MSNIDLKHATIYIEDGYDGGAGMAAAAVNNMAGYTAGAVTMAVDGITGEPVPVGTRFTVAGDDLEHAVTSATGTPTTSITFTPALADAVVDDAAITILPHQVEVQMGDGNLTYSEKRNMEYKLNRGLLNDVREGDQIPVEAKIDGEWEFLRSVSGAVTPTFEEALKRLGPAATWVSSDPDTCRPFAVNIVVLYVPPCGGVDKEKITLRDYRWESLDHDPKAAQISTSGKCNVTQADVARIPVA